MAICFSPRPPKSKMKVGTIKLIIGYSYSRFVAERDFKGVKILKFIGMEKKTHLDESYFLNVNSALNEMGRFSVTTEDMTKLKRYKLLFLFVFLN